MIGGHVTTRSRSSTRWSSVRRLPRRNTSIQALVSTRNTALPCAVHAASFAHDGCPVSTHLADVALPQARTGQLVDGPRLGPTYEFLQGTLDSARVRTLAADANCFFQQILINHNIRTFHTYTVSDIYAGRCVRSSPSERQDAPLRAKRRRRGGRIIRTHSSTSGHLGSWLPALGRSRRSHS